MQGFLVNPAEENKMATALLTELWRLFRLWKNIQPPPPLTKGDLAMLHTVKMWSEKRPLSISAVARLTGQSAPGVSRRVADLELAGYLRRRPDNRDRRISYVELTQKGREEGNLAFQQLSTRLQNAMGSIGEDNAEELLALLRRLVDEFEQLDNGNTRPYQNNAREDG